jgi:hypothetical protein
MLNQQSSVEPEPRRVSRKARSKNARWIRENVIIADILFRVGLHIEDERSALTGVGRLVQLHGLVSRPNLNGQMARVVAYRDGGRYGVEVEGSVIDVRVVNMRMREEIDHGWTEEPFHDAPECIIMLPAPPTPPPPPRVHESTPEPMSPSISPTVDVIPPIPPPQVSASTRSSTPPVAHAPPLPPPRPPVIVNEDRKGVPKLREVMTDFNISGEVQGQALDELLAVLDKWASRPPSNDTSNTRSMSKEEYLQNEEKSDIKDQNRGNQAFEEDPKSEDKVGPSVQTTVLEKGEGKDDEIGVSETKYDEKKEHDEGDTEPSSEKAARRMERLQNESKVVEEIREKKYRLDGVSSQVQELINKSIEEIEKDSRDPARELAEMLGMGVEDCRLALAINGDALSAAQFLLHHPSFSMQDVTDAESDLSGFGGVIVLVDPTDISFARVMQRCVVTGTTLPSGLRVPSSGRWIVEGRAVIEEESVSRDSIKTDITIEQLNKSFRSMDHFPMN